MATINTKESGSPFTKIILNVSVRLLTIKTIYFIVTVLYKYDDCVLNFRNLTHPRELLDNYYFWNYGISDLE